MNRSTLRRWLLGVLVVALASGCVATRQTGTGGSGSEVRGRLALEGEALQAAQRAEAATALGHVWIVAREEREVGASLVFTFWVERGALTLRGFQRTSGEGQEGTPVQEEDFTRQLRPLLTEYIRGHTGEVVLTLRRQRTGWSADYEATQGNRPAEAKTQPVHRWGAATNTEPEALRVASEMARLLPVPAGGTAALRGEVTLEDDRIVGWELRDYQVMEAGGRPSALSEQSVGRIAHVLLPFSQGVGRRTVMLEVRGAHQQGETEAHGHVQEARTLEQGLPLMEDTDFAAEYRALHEGILRRWREGVREGAELLARYTLEELALWFVGGILTRGAGLVWAAAAPTVARVLSRGGTGAVGWLLTNLRRLPQAEQKAFQRLWTKIQMEGAETLSRVERQNLSALMGRMEHVLRVPLSPTEKDALRSAARRYYRNSQVRLSEAMLRRGPYDVHHRYPLEYTQVFPEMDVNTPANLRAVGKEVHEAIGRVWTEFRVSRHDASMDEVEKMVAIVDTHFSRWYELPYARGDATAQLHDAVVAAIREVKMLGVRP